MQRTVDTSHNEATATSGCKSTTNRVVHTSVLMCVVCVSARCASVCCVAFAWLCLIVAHSFDSTATPCPYPRAIIYYHATCYVLVYGHVSPGPAAICPKRDTRMRGMIRHAHPLTRRMYLRPSICLGWCSLCLCIIIALRCWPLWCSRVVSCCSIHCCCMMHRESNDRTVQ